MNRFNFDKLDDILNQALSKKYIHGAVFHMATGDGKQRWISAVGNMNTNSPYYIASINKLFVSAIILRLIYEN